MIKLPPIMRFLDKMTNTNSDSSNVNDTTSPAFSMQTVLGSQAATVLSLRLNRAAWQNQGVLQQTNLEGLAQRQTYWQHQARKLSAYPAEFLLPRVDVRYRDELPGVMRAAEQAYQSRSELFDEIMRSHWGYYFYLGGGCSTRDNERGDAQSKAAARALSLMRFQTINDTVARILGENIGQYSLLDFACNWGGFAIDMAWRGMRECMGFDLRSENVQKANLLADYLGVTNVSFTDADVYEIRQHPRRFDVVYNLGLLYHVMDPYTLMEITYQMCEKMAVVDTIATREPFSGFLLNPVATSPQAEHAKGTLSLELRPTYRAIIDLMHAVGFRDLIEVVADLGDEYPESHSKTLYQNYHRRVVIGFK